MPLAETLQKIEADIQAGDLGKARDRLNGLLSTYPEKIALRRKLAEIHLDLQDPCAAGRWAYLVPDRSADLDAAVAVFEAACGSRAAEIARRLKVRAPFDRIDEPYARERLSELAAEARSTDRIDIASGRHEPSRTDTFIAYGCMLSLAAILVFAMIGAVSASRWLFGDR